MAIDEWQRLQPACFVQLGTLYQKMRSPDRPEILFSRAVALQSRGLIPEALFYYGRAAEGADPQIRRVALIEKARLATGYAASLYKKECLARRVDIGWSALKLLRTRSTDFSEPGAPSAIWPTTRQR